MHTIPPATRCWGGGEAWVEVLELIFQHVLCLPPLEQPLWCVQVWWHSLAVTKVSPRCGDVDTGDSPALLRRSW